MESIGRVVYINLDERVDRNQQIQQELATVFPVVERFAAIKQANGAIGCTMSHIAVLERAKAEGWPSVLIVEDDFAWRNKEAGLPVLERLLKKPYDVIVLTATYIHIATHTKVDLRLQSCQTTTAYVVAAAYYDTLLANYKEGLAALQAGGDYRVCALDQYWKRLQVRDRWFIVQPILGIQRPGYSDIEGRVVNYVRYFDLK